MKQIFIILLLLCSYGMLRAQTQVNSAIMQWHTDIDLNNTQDWTYSIVTTDKKEYIACGYSFAGTANYYPTIFKLDHLGKIVWQKTITTAGGTISNTGKSGALWQVVKAADGYVAVGSKRDISGNFHTLITEIDDNGNFLNNTPVLMDPTSPVAGSVVSGTINSNQAFSVGLDPTYNSGAGSVNSIILGGTVAISSSLTATYAFLSKVSGSGSLSVSSSIYLGKNYGTSGCGTQYYGGNNFWKILTAIPTSHSGAYDIYACGYVSASTNDNVFHCINNLNSLSIGVPTYDKDMWFVRIDNTFSTSGSTDYTDKRFDKSGGTSSSTYTTYDITVGGTTLSTVNTTTYPYQEKGPLTARNFGGSTSCSGCIAYHVTGTPTSSDLFSPTTAPLNSSVNQDEEAFDMVFTQDGKIALLGLVNYIKSGTTGVGNGVYLIHTADQGTDHDFIDSFVEYHDGDAFLLKLNMDGTPVTSSDIGKNIGHFSGTNWLPKIKQDKYGDYIIAGTTADDYGSSTTYSMANPKAWEQNIFLVSTNDASSPDIWRRSCYATDKEDCFCGFGLDLTADGGFIIAGNNGENGDDCSITKFAPTYAAKQYRNNLFNAVANPYPFNLGLDVLDFSVSSYGTSPVYTGTINVDKKIIVESGVTLTFNNATINFASSDHLWDYFQNTGASTPSTSFTSGNNPGVALNIDIKPGGKLIITNSTLQGLSTTQGDHYMWDGIVAEGTNVPRTTISQGRVIISNSTIKDARYGLMAADCDRSYLASSKIIGSVSGNNYSSLYGTNRTKGGGIVNVSGSTFQNCYTGINLQNYTKSSPTTLNPQIKTSTFTCTAAGLGDVCYYTDANGNVIPSREHFASWLVDGIEIEDNIFTCDLSFNPSIRSQGVHVVDAGIDISATPNFLTTPVSFGPGNTFSNLSMGINGVYTPLGSSHKMTVLRNTFDNNLTGANVANNTGGLVIYRNNFYVPGNTTVPFQPNSIFLLPPMGVNLFGCDGYSVDYNTIDHCSTCSGTPPLSCGIHINQGRATENRVDHNIIHNVRQGMVATLTNGGYRFPLLPSGLQYFCNDYNTGSEYGGFVNSYVILNDGTLDYHGKPGALPVPPGTIRPQQGIISSGPSTTTQLANNTFNNACIGGSHLFADMYVSETITYYTNSSFPYNPGTCITSQYANTPIGTTLTTCPSGVMIDGGTNHTMVLSSGNTNLGIGAVSAMDATIASTQTSDPSYADLLTQRDLMLNDWALYYNYNGYYDSAAKLMENHKLFTRALPFYLQESSWTDAGRMLDSMQLNNSDDSLYHYLGTLALGLDSSGHTWFDMDSTDMDSLIHIVQMDHWAGYMAGAIDSLLGLGPLQWPVPFTDSADTVGTQEQGKHMPLQSPVINSISKTFSVYPNPNNGNFTVNCTDAGIMEICSIDGRVIGRYEINKGNTNILLPTNISPGVYLGRYVSNDGKVNDVARLIYQP